MAAKVDERVLARIIELREKYGLTQAVIGIRLGLSTRTVRLYLSEHRKKQCSAQQSLTEDSAT
jgi:DNA-binding transcriptional regulator YiaG